MNLNTLFLSADPNRTCALSISPKKGYEREQGASRSLPEAIWYQMSWCTCPTNKEDGISQYYVEAVSIQPYDLWPNDNGTVKNCCILVSLAKFAGYYFVFMYNNMVQFWNAINVYYHCNIIIGIVNNNCETKTMFTAGFQRLSKIQRFNKLLISV